MRIRVGIDVDGPCAAMIEGFLEWVNNTYRLPYTVTRDMIRSHNDMGSSPQVREVDTFLRQWYKEPGSNGGFGGVFLEFMRNPTVYSDHIRPTPGAQDAIEVLRTRCDCLFVTALMKRANQHVPNKLDWIGRHFPGVSIATVPSEYKCWVRPTFGIDDRYDTCARWAREGVVPIMYQTPWSEAPPTFPGYDWQGALALIEAHLDRLERSTDG